MVPISTVQRIVAAVFSLMLYTMAWLQLNDPDPMLWVAIYVVIASLGLAAVVKGVHRTVVGGALVIALAWSAWLSPSVYELFMFHSAQDLLTGMSPDRPYVEESREALGLLIGAAGLAHLLLASRKSR